MQLAPLDAEEQQLYEEFLQKSKLLSKVLSKGTSLKLRVFAILNKVTQCRVETFAS